MAKTQLPIQELNTGYTAFSTDYLDTVLHNNFYTVRPTLEYLRANKETYSGGHEIRVPVWDAIEAVGNWYTRAGTFTWQGTDPVTSAVYYAVQIQEPVVLLYADEARYTGIGAKLNFAKAHLDNASERLGRKLNQALYAASPDTSKEINSLVTAIANSGTFGLIDPSTTTMWKSQVKAGGSFASQGPADLRYVWTDVTKWSKVGSPDRIFVDKTTHEAAQAMGFNKLTYYGAPKAGSKNGANLNAGEVAFNEADLVYDPDCTSGVAYFLNKRAISLVEHPEQGLTVRPWVDLRPAGIMGRGTNIVWMGQLVVKSRAALGKVTGISA